MGLSSGSAAPGARFRWTPVAPLQIAAASQLGLIILDTQVIAEAASTHVRGWGLRTGRLRGSYADSKKTPLSREITNSTYYAKYVEFGTSRMRAQKHLRLAAQKVASRYVNVQFFSANGG
jgi:hypothetical protein